MIHAKFKRSTPYFLAVAAVTAFATLELVHGQITYGTGPCVDTEGALCSTCMSTGGYIRCVYNDEAATGYGQTCASREPGDCMNHTFECGVETSCDMPEVTYGNCTPGVSCDDPAA
jgi:hypothetical protein